MGGTSDKKPPADRGDRFTLDFGKNSFRVDEKVEKAESFQKKLPPAPGPLPGGESVPASQVLNRWQLDKKK